jgi:hypothetical protein
VAFRCPTLFVAEIEREAASFDEAIEQQLRALGYIE